MNLRTYGTANAEIHHAVFNLRDDLDLQREVYRENLERALVLALHFPDMFKKAKWR
jgi:hypothetical protein